MREQQDHGVGGVGSGDDGEVDDEAGRSSEYLEHYTQYLSQRNFVNDVSQDLDTLQDQPPAASDSQWSAEFEFDDAEFSVPDGETPFGTSSSLLETHRELPVGTAAGALFDFDSSRSVTQSSAVRCSCCCLPRPCSQIAHFPP